MIPLVLFFQGHIGSSNWGIPLLLNGHKSVFENGDHDQESDSVIEDDGIDIVRSVVAMAQDCEVLTIRG